MSQSDRPERRLLGLAAMSLFKAINLCVINRLYGLISWNTSHPNEPALMASSTRIMQTDRYSGSGETMNKSVIL